jgi:hypothetical protein
VEVVVMLELAVVEQVVIFAHQYLFQVDHLTL